MCPLPRVRDLSALTAVVEYDRTSRRRHGVLADRMGAGTANAGCDSSCHRRVIGRKTKRWVRSRNAVFHRRPQNSPRLSEPTGLFISGRASAPAWRQAQDNR